MAAVAEQKNDAVTKLATRVDEQIAQATSRIRIHDLSLGALSLAAMLSVYATLMIVLDRYLNLAEWVRQLGLVAFSLGFAAIAYVLVLQPLRKRINPLYAAARVEDTIEDSKNSITGYVEAQDNDRTPASVKAAMSARAAKSVSEADVNQAVDHRSLLVVGGVLVLFLITLAALFLVFRPTQFTSLLSRAFLPFTSTAIASRTQITLVKPENPEPTLTAGQTITVAVYISGKVPAKGAPNQARLLLRHNPADPNYEEIPLEAGETSRDWQLKIPDYLVQNGFWYKVAAGDAETAEYRVTVRSLPLFTDFDVTYEYPKYTRLPNEKATDPNLRAYPGTKITLLARANREPATGQMKFEANTIAPVVGKPVPGKPDTLAFAFTAVESTRYRLFMTTLEGETNTDPPPWLITLDSDAPPRLEITLPEEAESTAPANGQLAVNGTISDDFGIDKVRLRLRVDQRDLAPIFFEGGKSFRREKDGTWPTNLVYKGSADLTKLMFADGQKFEPKEGMAIEFWLEAIDNCTETKPVEGWGDVAQTGQVGRSDVRRVQLTAPQTQPEEKEQLNQRKDQRKNEEKQHNQQQQQQLDKENREPKQQPQDQTGEQQPPKTDMNPKSDQQKNPDKNSDEGGKDSKDGSSQPKKANGTDSKDVKDGMPQDGMGNPQTDSKKDEKGDNTKSGANDPNQKQTPKDGSTPPDKGMNDKGMNDKGMNDKRMNDKRMNDATPGGMNNTQPNQPDQAPMPRSEEEKQAEEQAKKVQDELNKNKGTGGDAKPNSSAAEEKDRTEPTEAKPQQPMPGDGQPSESKAPPTPKDGTPNPMGKQEPAAETKPEGDLQKPADPNPQAKPQPDTKAEPSENREAPLGGSAGEDKPEPKQSDKPLEPKGGNPPEPKGDDNQKPGTDPKSGSSGKPSSEQKSGEPNSEPKSTQDESTGNPGEKAGQAKPNVEPTRGEDKKSKPTEGNNNPSEPKPDAKAGDAKPRQAPPSGTGKPEPKDGDPNGTKQPEPSSSKPAPTDAKDPTGEPMNQQGGNVANAKPEPKKPMNQPGGMGDENAVQPGIDKPDQKGDSQNRTDQPKPNNNQAGKKPTQEDLKQLEDAARNLNNPDQAKRKDAQDKLDRAIGQDKRKELEQMAKDLESKDDNTRKAAEKKLEEMKKEAEAQAKKDSQNNGEKKSGSGGDQTKKDGQAGDKLSPEEVADLKNKLDDLASPDDAKREQAEKQFDEKVGKENREKLQEDLRKQKDAAAKEAAVKKEGMPERKLSEQETRDLQEKARDLDSPDEGKRQAAEQMFDEKLGKESREKIQNEVKRRNEELNKRLGGPDANELPPAAPDNPQNKAKTAQLQLEEFEKNRYNKDLQEKLGWNQQQMDEFLEAQRRRVHQLETEKDAHEEDLQKRSVPAGPPIIKAGGAGKVETRPSIGSGEGASGSGAVFAPPGFEKAAQKFLEAKSKLQQKK